MSGNVWGWPVGAVAVTLDLLGMKCMAGSGVIDDI